MMGENFVGKEKMGFKITIGMSLLSFFLCGVFMGVAISAKDEVRDAFLESSGDGSFFTKPLLAYAVPLGQEDSADAEEAEEVSTLVVDFQNAWSQSPRNLEVLWELFSAGADRAQEGWKAIQSAGLIVSYVPLTPTAADVWDESVALAEQGEFDEIMSAYSRFSLCNSFGIAMGVLGGLLAVTLAGVHLWKQRANLPQSQGEDDVENGRKDEERDRE